MACYNEGMEFVTVQDAAVLLRVSPKAIYYALAENKLTRHKQFGRVVLDKEEVNAYQPRAGADRPSRRRSIASREAQEASVE